MTLPLIILTQTVCMALYMAAGFALFKCGKITQTGSKDLGTLLLWLVIPAVIIDSFCVPFSWEKLQELGWSTLLGVIALALSILISRLMFPHAPIDHFAAAFSNAGFIGIPLVKESLGNEAVFYLVGIITILNILQWTYGSSVLGGNQSKLKLTSLLCNPIFTGAAIGFILFVSGIGGQLPTVVETAIDGVAATNAPLAMLVLGVYLAQTKLKSLILTPRLYIVSIARLILVPLITLLVFWAIPLHESMKLAVLIAAAAPVGANVAVYAQLYHLDYPYACKTVVLSTLLSIVTLPLLTAVAAKLF